MAIMCVLYRNDMRRRQVDIAQPKVSVAGLGFWKTMDNAA